MPSSPHGFADPWEHVRLLSDRARNDAMLTMLARTAPGRRVLEVGCGTGVLACAAARMGAREVWAVEPTSQADAAEALVRTNGLGGIVHVLRGRVEDLPPRPVDLAFSELLNADPFSEGVIPAMHAASRWLAPGGVLAPARLRVWAALTRAGGSAREARAADAELRRIGDVYDLDLSSVHTALRRAQDYRSVTATEAAIGPAVLVWEVDLATGSLPTPVELTLTTSDAGPVAGVVIWFEADMGDGETITNPTGTPDHWGQLVCAWREERGMRAHEEVRVRLHLAADGVHACRADEDLTA